MNALRTPRSPSTPVRAAVSPSPAAPVSNVHRERDFGIGYGKSSGYGSVERRYTAAANAPSYFRCR